MNSLQNMRISVQEANLCVAQKKKKKTFYNNNAQHSYVRYTMEYFSFIEHNSVTEDIWNYWFIDREYLS